jgi:hypothetical protein
MQTTVAMNLANKIDSLIVKIDDIPYFVSTISPEKMAQFEEWINQGKKLAESLIEVKA